MNAIAQKTCTPSCLRQYQPPNGGSSWDVEYYADSSCLVLALQTAPEGAFTTVQLCQRLWSSQEIMLGARQVYLRCQDDDFTCLDGDLEAVGNVLHYLQSFDHLAILGPWRDEKVSVLLRHMPKVNFRGLSLSKRSTCLLKRIPAVLAELQQASLQELRLWHVELNDVDCTSLGRVLKCRQPGEEVYIKLCFCTFLSLTGYLVVADALIGSGPFSFTFRQNKVSDATIPPLESSVIPVSHGDFYNIFKERGRRRFNITANDHLHRYSDLNSAGRVTLVSHDNTATIQDWVDALCHDKVRDSIDYLFYFLTLNPSVYASAALP